MKRLRRQRPFLDSIMKEANRLKRQDLLTHANGDQIDAVSEMVLNLLKEHIPDAKMIKGIDNLPGRKTMTERVVKKIMQAKKRLKL